MSAPTSWHQQYSINLAAEIRVFLKGKPCRVYATPYDVRLTYSTGSGDAQIQTVVRPDSWVVCDLSKIDTRGCLGAPNWIIEILSPGNVDHDTKTKFDLYEEKGVNECWIAIPGLKTIQTFVLAEAGRYQIAAEYTAPGPMPVATLPGLAVE